MILPRPLILPVFGMHEMKQVQPIVSGDWALPLNLHRKHSAFCTTRPIQMFKQPESSSQLHFSTGSGASSKNCLIEYKYHFFGARNVSFYKFFIIFVCSKWFRTWKWVANGNPQNYLVCSAIFVNIIISNFKMIPDTLKNVFLLSKWATREWILFF